MRRWKIRDAGWLASALLLAGMSIAPAASTVQASPIHQAPAIDPVVRASAQQGASVVAATLRPSAALADASAPDLAGVRGALTSQPPAPPSASSEEEPVVPATPTEEPVEEVTEESTVEEPAEDPTPTPSAEGSLLPDPTPTPSSAEAASPLPEIDFSNVEVAQYSNQGIALQAPADWAVTTGGFGSLFNIEVPGTEFVAIMQDIGDEFPGALGVIIFRSMGEALVKEFDANAELIGVETLQTGQQLPVVKIEFAAPIEGVDAAGAFYVVSPGDTAYMLIAFAPVAEWESFEPGVDLIAQSVFFDAFLITLTAAESGEIVYADEAGTVEITLPQDWQVTETGDPDVPVLVIDPTFSFGGALFSDADDTGLADIQALIGADGGDFDDALVEQFVLAVMGSLELGDTSDLILDSDVTDVAIDQNQALVRLGGLMQSADGFEMPMIFYVQADVEGLVALVCFGDVAEVLSQDAVLRELVTSAVALP